MWVGRELGDVALAALTNANLLWIVLFAAAFGVSMAGSVRVAQCVGKGDIEGAKAAIGTSVSISGIVSMLCVALMEILARPLLECLGTPTECLRQAVDYLRILLLSVPLSYIYSAVIGALRGAGDSKTALRVSCALIATDVLLNPCFIRGLGPLPALGIVGPAVATLISQAIGVGGLVGHLYWKHHGLCLHYSDRRLVWADRSGAWITLRQSGPMAVQFLWTTVESMLIISLVNRFGADTTAAYGVVIQIWNVIAMPAGALGVAVTSMVAQNIGAMRWDRVKRTTCLGLAYGATGSALLVILAEVLGWVPFRLFLPAGSPALVIAGQINHEATWSLVIYGAYSVWVGVLRATGVVWVPLLISVSVLAVRFPLTDALLSEWHARAIWLGFPASAAATGALAVLHGWLSHRARVQPQALGT